MYNKTLAPPETLHRLQTPEGLTYWAHDPGPIIGCQYAILTEDPSISMHVYGGMGREGYQSFLFRYKGTQMGFMNTEVRDGMPLRSVANPADEDTEANIRWWRIRFLGTPVYDVSAMYERDAEGKLLEVGGSCVPRRELAAWRDCYVTGLTWDDYDAGKRDKFPSRQIQDEMLALWPWLFNGYLFDLDWPRLGRIGGKGNSRPVRMRFDEAVLRDLQAGVYL